MAVTDAPRTFRSHTVWTRRHWADDWVQQADVYCDKLKFTCSPEIARADFSYTYGRVIPFGKSDFVNRDKLDLTDYYVRVRLTQTDGTTLTWYGVIVDTERNQYGDGYVNTADTTKNVAMSGKQKFVALGLEYLLEREIYDSSWVKINSTGSEREVFRGIAFNMQGGNAFSRHLVGNMEALGDRGVPVFAFSLEAPTREWDGETIIEYLLEYHAPKDKSDAVKVPWKSDITLKDSKTLKAIKPRLDVHGESVKSIIDAICDRRRALSWYISVDETSSPAKVNVKIFTFNSVDLPLEGGDTIPANADQVDINLANDARLIDNPLFTSSTTKFHRVKARGAPATVTLSLQETSETEQGTLIKDWTSAQQTAYNAGASADSSYSSLATSLGKAWANAAYRNAQKFERVYRYFLWSPSKIYDELPLVEINGRIMRVWPAGARFMSYCPLKLDVDYTTPSTTLTSDKPGLSVDEYMRPLAVIKNGTRYYDLTRPGKQVAAAEFLIDWSASLRTRHDQCGVAIDVHGASQFGASQHAIAKDEFVAADTNDVIDFTQLRWQDIIVTAAIELDQFAEAQWPKVDTPLDTTDDCIKELIIQVPDRRMDYIAKNCVFDVKADGTVKKTAAGGWIKDDSEKLLWVAAIAYLWYQTERKSLEYTLRSLDCAYHVGQLVANLITATATPAADRTTEALNSVITSIEFDLLAGTYKLATSFADLDAKGLVL